jgi:D-glycero-D-manno-heptose 1,7-bisphosphate phosphatase
VNVNAHRALFLDRDGVINHDAGYTSRVEDFHFIDGIFDLCRAARQAGYLLVVVTNQAGIGRGYYSEDDFLALTTWMRQRFVAEGAPLADVYYCPFHPEHGIGDYKQDSLDRKPHPGMLLRAAQKHSIDLKHSILVGDKDSDMQAASAAGVAVRCQYLVNTDTSVLSNAATHKIDALQDGLSLLEDLRL